MSLSNTSKVLISAENEYTGKVIPLQTTQNGDLRVSVVHSGDDSGEASAVNQVRIIKNLSTTNTDLDDATGIGKFFADRSTVDRIMIANPLNPIVENDGLQTAHNVQIQGSYDNAGVKNLRTIACSADGSLLGADDENLKVVFGEVSVVDASITAFPRLRTILPQPFFNGTDGLSSFPQTGLYGWTDEPTAPYGRSIRCSDKGQLHSQLLGLTDITDQTTHQYIKCNTDGELNISTQTSNAHYKVPPVNCSAGNIDYTDVVVVNTDLDPNRKMTNLSICITINRTAQPNLISYQLMGFNSGDESDVRYHHIESFYQETLTVIGVYGGFSVWGLRSKPVPIVYDKYYLRIDNEHPTNIISNVMFSVSSN